MDAPLKGGRWRALRRCGVGEDIGAGVGLELLTMMGLHVEYVPTLLVSLTSILYIPSCKIEILLSSAESW